MSQIEHQSAIADKVEQGDKSGASAGGLKFDMNMLGQDMIKNDGKATSLPDTMIIEDGHVKEAKQGHKDVEAKGTGTNVEHELKHGQVLVPDGNGGMKVEGTGYNVNNSEDEKFMNRGNDTTGSLKFDPKGGDLEQYESGKQNRPLESAVPPLTLIDGYRLDGNHNGEGAQHIPGHLVPDGKGGLRDANPGIESNKPDFLTRDGKGGFKLDGITAQKI